jgi:integrase
MSKFIMTDRSVLALKHIDKRQEKADHRVVGLYLIAHAAPSTKKNWCVRFRWAGKPAKFVLLDGAPYPTIGLEAARTAGMTALEAVANGRDPRVAGGTADAPTGSLGAAVALYKSLKVLDAKTARRNLRYLGHLISAFGGDRPVVDIKRSELQGFTNRFVGREVNGERKGDGAHKSCIDAVKSLFTFLVEQNAIEQSPATLIKRPHIKGRENALDDEQIKIFWQASENAPKQHRFTARMLLLTGCRKSEITKLRRAQVNGVAIKIPREDRKAEVKEHAVHLTSLMRAELDRFPDDGREHVLSDAEFFGSDNACRNAIETPFDWVLHDLRHTMYTGLIRLKSGRVIAKLCTGKATDDEYDHHEYAEEMKEWWQRWSDHVTRVVTA